MVLASSREEVPEVVLDLGKVFAGLIGRLLQQATVASENARLLAEAQQRAAQLHAAAEVAHDASGILDTETLLERVAELIRERFDLYYVGIFLLDETGRWAVLRAGTGEAGQRMLETGHRLEVGGDSMIGWCTAHGEARIALDVGEEAIRFDNPLLPETRSEMALPLISRGRVIGAMTIQSDKPVAFSQEDISILQTMAGQLANAIENARLHREQQRHLVELAALNEIGRAITAVLDPRELAEAVYRQIDRFTRAPYFQVALWDQETDTILAPLTVEDGRFLYDQRVHWDSVVGWVLRQGEPLFAEDIQRTEGLPPLLSLLLRDRPQIRSIIVVPITIGARVIGALSIQSPQPGAYREEDLDFLTAVVGQVAVAFHNARLYAETRRRAEELAALNAVAARLGQSLELRDVLETAMEEVARVLGVEASAVSLVDGPKGDLVLRAQHGLRHSYVGMRIPAGQGLSGEVVLTGKPLVTGAVEDNPRLAVRSFAQEGVQAMALVPMYARGKVVGVLSAMSHTPRQFSPQDISLLQAIASQVGIAVENARLFEAERAQRQTAEMLRRIAAVLTSSLEIGQVLERLLEYLEVLVPYDQAVVFLFEEGTLQSVACRTRGKESGEEVHVGRSVPLSTASLLREVVEGRSTVLISDAEEDPRWRQVPLQGQTKGWIGVPLIVRGRSIGVMSLSRAEQTFTEEEAALAADIADHAAIAIENARLYRAVTEHATELERAYERLKEADRLKDELIQNVSHELRTPLTFIKGYVELIRREDLGPLTEAQEASLEIVARKADHLAHLIGDFVTLRSVETQSMERRVIDLGEVVRKAAEGSRPTAEQAGIEMRLEIPADLSPVRADPARIAQVMDNLLSNAIKFSPDGGVITVRVREEGDFLRTEVSDTGIGIPADKLSRVFDRFYQVDGTIRRRFGGTGLGLAIVKEIVEAHGGEVGVSSKVGEGSTFHFTLPKASCSSNLG